MHCPTCRTELRPLQIETMVGNPSFNEWCRNGFCSLACFERRHPEADTPESPESQSPPQAQPLPPASPAGTSTPTSRAPQPPPVPQRREPEADPKLLFRKLAIL